MGSITEFWSQSQVVVHPLVILNIPIQMVPIKPWFLGGWHLGEKSVIWHDVFFWQWYLTSSGIHGVETSTQKNP